MEMTIEKSPSFKIKTFVYILFISLFVSIIFFISSNINVGISEIHIIRPVSNHAWDRHEKDADDALECLSKNGTMKSFRTIFPLIKFQQMFGSVIIKMEIFTLS